MSVLGRLLRWFGALAVVAPVVQAIGTSSAQAYCRTRTCGRSDAPACMPDAEKCPTVGAPLFWPGESIRFLVDASGSPRRNISGEAAQAVLIESLTAWTSVFCEDGTHPSISVASVDLVRDPIAVREGLTSPDEDHPTQEDVSNNVLAFVDEGWIYDSPDVVALTTVTFGVKSGRIVATDIEVNSDQVDITASDSNVDFDLLSVLTHESGHVFGLADLFRLGPTMNGRYAGGGDLGPRSLEPDDIAGICAIYPANRFQHESGCSCGVAGGGARLGASALFGAGALLLALRRRKIARPQSHSGTQARMRGSSTM
ncbi:MAG TPA: MYXO-CTERM sorting domain-containing protein [Polyangiaceae bacterium]|nr:MYXO-CTERM sorting domain-containing protein [Polyangiaceae bacterium]